MKPIHIISLGAGVQSSTMALKAAAGELPMPDGAIFADTQAEPKSVYKWLGWLIKQLPFPVYKVTAGNLAKESLRLRVSKKTGYTYQRTLIPTFILKPTGKVGMLPRKCTKDFKINPIIKQARELVQIKRARPNEPVRLVSLIGISVDEAHRMKPSGHKWIENAWPLVDANTSRKDCLDWMGDNGFPKPPRSACTFCPYHSDDEWMRLKVDDPEDFAEAVEWEKQNQIIAAQQSSELIEGVPFLHKSCVPLDQVNFVPGKNKGQFGNECEGMCGV